MKKHEILPFLYQIASPVAMIALGVILVVNPDSASAMIARLQGWVVLLTGAIFGIAAVVSRSGTMGKIVGAVLCLSFGSWLLANPLMLAAWIGRLIGVFLLIRGGRDFAVSHLREGKILSAIVAAVGAVLILLPMTTSRLVFMICGLVVAVMGVAMLIERLKEHRYLEGGDSDIIDAL